MNDDDVVCIARIRDNDMAALVYNQLRGVINHPDVCKDVHDINVEMESLKTVIEVLDSVGKPGCPEIISVNYCLWELYSSLLTVSHHLTLS